MFRVVVGWNSTEFLKVSILLVFVATVLMLFATYSRRVWVVLPLAVDVSTVSRSSVEATTSNVNQALLANLAAPPLQSWARQARHAGECRAMPGLWNLYVPNRVCSSHLPLVGGCRCSWSLLTLFVTPHDSTAPHVMGSRKGLHCRFNTEAGWKKFWCRRSWFLGPKCCGMPGGMYWINWICSNPLRTPLVKYMRVCVY